MGQSASLPVLSPELTRLSTSRSSRPLPPTSKTPTTDHISHPDFTSNLPDECLALMFQSLSAGDRKRCSHVCKRWLRVEGESRHRLSLNAQSDLANQIPTLFSRFDSVAKLALRCDRRSISINDDALVSVSLRCPNLTRLKLRACRELSDLGVASLARHCTNLKKLSCGNCDFGTKGLNAVFHHCPLLEELSIKRLRGINVNNGSSSDPIVPCLASKSLKSLCLKEQLNGQMFGPLITGCKNLRTLKLIRSSGDWDRVLISMANSNSNPSLVEVHLERLEVSDAGLLALSNCANLEILHIVKAPECTNLGVISVAHKCKLLRKVHIDGWRTNRIGDEGLTALGKNCSNLQELVLIGINPTIASLEVIASNCRNLERLALCSSETIRDAEISCLATKCVALKKLCVKSCPISDNGLEALGWGFPNLVKVKVKKCKEVTRCIIQWLKMTRESLVVNLDADEVEPSVVSDGPQEDVFHVPHEMPPTTQTRQSSFRSKFGFLVGRNISSCALRRWSIGTSSSNTSN